MPDIEAELRSAEQILTRWEQGYELHTDECVAVIEGLYKTLSALDGAGAETGHHD